MRIIKVNILRIVFTVDQNKGRKLQEIVPRISGITTPPNPPKKIYYLIIFTQNMRACQVALV